MSSKNPHLIVIAGPNGAGKSSTSHHLVKPYGITPFDWDKLFYYEWSKFQFDPLVAEGVREAAILQFENELGKALNNMEHFAFETNFHTESVFDIANRFRNKGFETTLHFLMLPSIELCRQRVQKRVQVDRGHPVSDQDIKYRFEHGLINLNTSLDKFDNVLIYDASLNYELKAMTSFEKGELVGKYSPLPDEIKEYIPELARMNI